MRDHAANSDYACPRGYLASIFRFSGFIPNRQADGPRHRCGIALALIWALTLFLFDAGASVAQQSISQPLLFPGNAVVTGFSGTSTPYSRGDLPENSTAADETFLNLDGASLRVMELEAIRPDSAGSTLVSPQLFQVRAADTGQVFGVALDDAMLSDGETLAPNIYVTATSAYGLRIVGPDADGDGFPERLKIGGPDATWMPGLFGLAKDGGPGTIWKIDGVTAEVSLFANIEYDGEPNSGPALGNIAFDPVSRQLFVSDRDTGMIHRLDLQGQDLGTFDHGLDGRPRRQLHPVGFDPDERTSITSNEFLANDPETWGYASPERRIWGLALRDGRLYYAVAEGPQIWSVAIQEDGSFGRARWEIDLPEDIEPYEVSDIAFTSEGRMVLAQRAPVTGAYDYAKPIESSGARVLRYRLERPNRRRTPSRWVAEPDEYAIGQTGDYRNTDGGVAIGYGYTRAGNFNYRACRAALWTTGDRLKQVPRRTLAPRTVAATEEQQFIDGLQGNAITLVRPENEPPTNARFVDFDGAYNATETSGHVGDVEIPVICDPEEPYAPPPPPPPAERVLDLELEKKQIGACSIFDICAFEITIRNKATETYRGPLVIRDVVSQSGMDLVSFGAVPWECAQSGAEISCRRPELVLNPGRETHLYVYFRLLAKIQIPGWRNCGTISWLGDRESETTIRSIQVELTKLGFYLGPIDGDLTPATEQAIKDLEVVAGLPATGEISPELMQILFGPGVKLTGDANPANDSDCADVEYIVAAPGPGGGPGPIQELAALEVTIGGAQECPFGEECPLELTIGNNLPVPFDQEIDGLVELKRLGVQVPEQIAQAPSFCAGPVGQMDVNCRFRLQLAPNQARSYPMRMNIQSPLLDPTDAANRGVDGVVRAEACFAAKDLGWFGWLFGQEIDRDCHSFVVPDAAVAPGEDIPEPEDEDWIAANGFQFAKKGPASCTFGETCTFEVTFRSTSNDVVPLSVSDATNRMSAGGAPTSYAVLPITSIEPQLCDPELSATAASVDDSCKVKDDLNIGENRTYRITIKVDNGVFDPGIEANRGTDGKVGLQNCFRAAQGKSSCVVVPVVAPDTIADDAPADDEQAPEQVANLEINKTARKTSCRRLEPCLFDILVKVGDSATTGDRIRFIETFPEGVRSTAITSSDGSIGCEQQTDRQFLCTGAANLSVAAGQEFKLEASMTAGTEDRARGLENCVTLDQDGDGVADPSEPKSCAQVKLLAFEGDPPREPQPGPELKLTKRAINTSCKPGILCWFQIIIDNVGRHDSSDEIEIRDFIKMGDSSLDWPIEFGTSDQWQCEPPSEAPEYRACKTGGIAAGDSRKLTVKVLIPEAGDLPIPVFNNRILTNCATMHSSSGQMIGNQACAGSNIVTKNQVSFLKLEKLAPGECPEGGRCEFYVRIQARGERGLAQQFTLIDKARKIGGTLIAMPIVAGGPGCATAPDRIPFSCRRRLSLPPFQNDPQRLLFGEDVDNADSVVTELSYQVKMPPELKAGDRFENCFELLFSFEGKVYRPVTCTTVSVTGDQEELNQVTQDLTPADEAPVEDAPSSEEPADESPTRTAPLAGRFGPQLAITKVGDSRSCNSGDECSYSVSIANRGAAPYFGSLVFSDRMKPGNVRLLGTDPSPWACRGKNGRFTCTHPSTRLAVGESKTVRLRFRTAKSTRGNQNNCAQFTWRDSTYGGRVVAAKQALAELGLDPGPLDARVTRQTRNAIRSFQRQQKIRVSGNVNSTLMKALIKDWGQGDQNTSDDRACADIAIGRAPDTSTPITCPQGQRLSGSTCVPICTGGRTLVSGRCQCGRRQVFDAKAGRCRAQCASGTRWDGRQCVSRCPEAERWDARRNRCVNRCPTSQAWDGRRCVNRCSAAERWDSRRGRCVNRCSASQRWDSRRDRCVNRCSSSQRWDGRRCVARCKSSQRWDSRRNRCVNRCSNGKEWRNNRCQCPSGQTEVRGKCTTPQSTPGGMGQTTNPGASQPRPVRCTGGKVVIRGKCACPAGLIEVRGRCIKLQIQPGRTINPNLSVPR